MVTGCGHYEEEMHEALDGRLSAERRASLDTHLATCPSCRRLFEELRWVKQQVARSGAALEVPAFLTERVARLLEDAEGQAGRAWPASPARPRWRLALGGALLAAAVLATIVIYRRPAADAFPAAVARDYRQYRSGSLPLSLVTSDVQAMERFFVEQGIGFRTRVFDLGMMEYRLVGGRVHSMAGRPSAVFVYQGKDGRVVVCQMYLGRASERPPPDARRTHQGIAFDIYRRDDLTLVFWEEGETTCVLAGQGDPETVVQLALAKAMKVA